MLEQCEYEYFILVLEEMKNASADWAITTSGLLPSEHAQPPPQSSFLVTKQLLRSRHMGLGFLVVSS